MTTPNDTRYPVWGLFLRAHSVITRRLDEELRAECGISIERFDVLMQLWETKRPMQMHEVADSLVLSRSGATRFIDTLEEAGLVARGGVANDRRGIAISLTPLGRKRLRAARAVHERGIQTYFTDSLTADEIRILQTAFEKVLGTMETPTLSDT